MDAKTMIVLIIVAILVFIILAAAIIVSFFNKTIDTAASSTKPKAKSDVSGQGRRVRFMDLKKYNAGSDDVSPSGAITTTEERNKDDPLPIDVSVDSDGNKKQCSRPSCSTCANTQKIKGASTDKLREFMQDFVKDKSGSGSILNRDSNDNIIFDKNINIDDVLDEKNSNKIKIAGYVSQQLTGLISAHIKGHVEGKYYDDYKQIICNGLVNATIDGYFIPFSEMFDKEGNLKNKIIVLNYEDENKDGFNNYLIEKNDKYNDTENFNPENIVYNEKERIDYNNDIEYEPRINIENNLNQQAAQFVESKYKFINDEDIDRNYLDMSGLGNQYRKETPVIYNRDDKIYENELYQQNYLINNKFQNKISGAIF